MLTVERAQSPEDWRAIRKVCALTGRAGGDPIEKERREFFSELWIGPYEKLSPDWGYVLRDTEEGGVAGYLVASPETRDFRRRKWFACDVPLFGQILLKKLPRNEDAKKFVRRFLTLEPKPEDLFSSAAWRLIHREYPAHLHMNLLPEARKKGFGRLLIERLIRDLRGKGVSGVHCICGEFPRKFYEKEGFTVIEEILVAGRVHLYLLARKASRA